MYIICNGILRAIGRWYWRLFWNLLKKVVGVQKINTLVRNLGFQRIPKALKDIQCVRFVKILSSLNSIIASMKQDGPWYMWQKQLMQFEIKCWAWKIYATKSRKKTMNDNNRKLKKKKTGKICIIDKSFKAIISLRIQIILRT